MSLTQWTCHRAVSLGRHRIGLPLWTLVCKQQEYKIRRSPFLDIVSGRPMSHYRVVALTDADNRTYFGSQFFKDKHIGYHVNMPNTRNSTSIISSRFVRHMDIWTLAFTTTGLGFESEQPIPIIVYHPEYINSQFSSHAVYHQEYINKLIN